MVPRSSSHANSKSDEKLKSPDILTKVRQFPDKFAWLNRIRDLPLKRATKAILPAGQLHGIRCPQNSTDRRTTYYGQKRPPAVPGLRHQRIRVEYSEGLVRVSYSAELVIRTRTRTRNGTAAPPELQIGSLCSSSPHSAGQLPEQSFKCKQPPPRTDGRLVRSS